MGQGYPVCTVVYCSQQNCVITDEEIADRHAQKISAEVEDRKFVAQEEFFEIQQETAARIESTFEDFKNFLTQLNVNIDYAAVAEENQSLLETVNNFAEEKILPRLDVNDKELALILAEADDNKRARNFDAFYERLFRNALRDLISAVEKNFRLQYYIVEDEIRRAAEEANDDA